jgi:ABC-type Fe3+ transport system substrate-binding protein
MRDFMAGPDIGGDADWDGGVSGPFIDKEKQYIFAYQRKAEVSIINREVLPNDKIGSFQDFLNPAYKGKMVWQDPRIGGAGVNQLTAFYSKYGKDGLQKILVDQAPMLVKGQNDVADQLLQAGKAISIADVTEDALGQYRKAGVKINFEPVALGDVLLESHGGSLVSVLKNAPHPNATKVYVNWILSKAGQEVVTQAQPFDSRRKDVPPVSDPARRARSGVQYIDVHQEQNMLVTSREAQTLAKQLLP